jgi:hypothetical protein
MVIITSLTTQTGDMNSATSQDGNHNRAWPQTGDSNEAITRQKSEMRIGQNNARWK